MFRFCGKIRTLGLTNLSVMEGDAKAELSDNFDVVLVLGPLYHLPPEEENRCWRRQSAFANRAELFCVLTPTHGGIFDKRVRGRKRIPTKRRESFALTGRWTIVRRIMVFTTSKQMQDAAEKAGLQFLQNTGVDFNFAPIYKMPCRKGALPHGNSSIHVRDPYAAALASHAVLVCRK